METDKHYFIEGLFIIVFSVAAAIFAVWLGSTGRHDDVVYRIHFPDSVSGLAVGDPVKFRGVDVGTVKSMIIDPDNSRLVLVEVRLRKETPVKTDTRASLALKGITGVVFIELNGGDPAAQTLLAATPAGKIPEIPSEKTGLKAMLDDLPKLVGEILGHRGPGQESRDGRRRVDGKGQGQPVLAAQAPEGKRGSRQEVRTIVVSQAFFVSTTQLATTSGRAAPC